MCLSTTNDRIPSVHRKMLRVYRKYHSTLNNNPTPPPPQRLENTLLVRTRCSTYTHPRTACIHLSSRSVAQLNRDARLPLELGSNDAVICTSARRTPPPPRNPRVYTLFMRATMYVMRSRNTTSSRVCVYVGTFAGRVCTIFCLPSRMHTRCWWRAG